MFTGLTAQKPKYEVGSALKLSFAKSTKTATVDPAWKISDDNEDDIINADDLLDEEDRNKPDSSSLRGKKMIQHVA